MFHYNRWRRRRRRRSRVSLNKCAARKNAEDTIFHQAFSTGKATRISRTGPKSSIAERCCAQGHNTDRRWTIYPKEASSPLARRPDKERKRRPTEFRTAQTSTTDTSKHPTATTYLEPYIHCGLRAPISTVPRRKQKL